MSTTMAGDQLHAPDAGPRTPDVRTRISRIPPWRPRPDLIAGELQVHVLQRPGDRVVLRLFGGVDVVAAPQLAVLLCQSIVRSGCVLLDLADVDFVDSSGRSALLAALDRAERSGRHLRLSTRLSPDVRRPLAASGTLLRFEEGDLGAGCARHPKPGTGRRGGSP
ncbi:STAS domain-containing protein [Pseudonocardia sp. HH130630-07]|uniref:STAS domain-containing protein n=1 Tax=Pseudonocardia sp. HH130630-07 TaxID=1690815 RepID=UPI000815328B|nr:STAS domain-containing protein [Pseudonocardia sp. HH130630-07]ANY06465.1 hypothetical protein AFB00_09365 [Pseudonocardia sp. HH130630-07]